MAKKSTRPSKQPAKKKTTAAKTKTTEPRTAQTAARRGPNPVATEAAAAEPSAAAAPVERYGLIELAGKPATVLGEDVVVGQQAPEFTAQANDWSEVNVIASTTGKVRILMALPSLSTDVCDRETRRFNQEAAGLDRDIQIIGISADLPPTQRNWCAANGVERVMTISDHMDLDFGQKYGAWIKERRYLRRAVFVLDRNDQIVYAAYMRAIGIEPNYDEVLAAAKAAL